MNNVLCPIGRWCHFSPQLEPYVRHNQRHHRQLTLLQTVNNEPVLILRNWYEFSNLVPHTPSPMKYLRQSAHRYLHTLYLKSHRVQFYERHVFFPLDYKRMILWTGKSTCCALSQDKVGSTTTPRIVKFWFQTNNAKLVMNRTFLIQSGEGTVQSLLVYWSDYTACIVTTTYGFRS